MIHKLLKKTRYWLILPLVLLATAGACAQSVEVKGKVTDEQGDGLPGVTVLLKGTTNGTTTNATGTYSLNIPNGSGTLIVSFIGYETKEVDINNQTTLNVSMNQDAKALEEVVVVGYGNQKKADITGAVGSIKGSELKAVSVANASSLLQGRVAGVVVQNGGSAPGQAPAVVIRGTGTFGNDQPLYVIDGMITSSMGFVNPNSSLLKY